MSLAGGSILFVPMAFAQDAQTANDGLQTYPRDYFDPYNPQTARDMIDRLPGFVLETGEELRGFGSGAGNVLINGARPSSKTGGVEEALERLIAGSVDRIEVIRGSAGSSEAFGQAVVANIITQKTDTSARWEIQLERASHGKINAAAELAGTQAIGSWDSSYKVNSFIERRPLDGSRISRNSADIPIFAEEESSPSDARQVALSAEAKRPLAAGLFTLNGRVSHTPGSSDTVRLGFDQGRIMGVADQRRNIFFERTTTDAEIGADWARTFKNDWSLKFLSLTSFTDVAAISQVSLERPVNVSASSSIFESQQDSFETVFRTTLARSGTQSLKPEFGGEIAFNKLSSELSLRVEDGGVESEIILPAANVTVEEIRGEAFANLIWAATPDLSLETGLAVEASDISVSGDASSSQSFVFAKPFATLIYDPKPGLQLRLGTRRTVGQLNFSDFAASASAADDRLLGGNPELGPDQTTRLSASVDLRSDTRGALNVELFHEWRDDILEQIILPSGAQGLGNAGSARVWGVTSTASIPLSSLLPGGLVEVEAEFLDSKFDDPILDGSRSVSSIVSPNIFIQFRQDIIDKNFSWGISYRAETEGPFFFADEISLNRDGRSWAAFFETTRYLGIKTNLEISGIGGNNFSRKRSFFEPDRGGAFIGSETISRDRGLFATLTFSGQF